MDRPGAAGYIRFKMKNLVWIVGFCLAALAARFAESTAPAGDTQALIDGFTGKVVETTNTAGYTYILVDTGKDRKWAAAPEFEVKLNDAVNVTRAMPMEKYHSKTLNRDFEVVYFTAAVLVNGVGPGDAAAAELPKNHPPIGGQPAGLPQGHPPIGGQAAAPPNLSLDGIAKAKGGNTVVEIWVGKDKLNGRETKLRGRVVKYNAEIMGKNWLHLRDGSGKDATSDILVTTDAPVRVGDLVLVTGKVAINKNFGAGYRYAVMVEDAKVTVE